MDWLQSLLGSETAPAATAFVLGLLTALSPCQLAANIVAVAFIGGSIDDRKAIFSRGGLYAFGRVAAYTVLGAVAIAILREGASMFGIQKFLAVYGGKAVGPALLLVGAFLLFGHRLGLPSFGYKGSGERIAKQGGWGAFGLGVLFAMTFCPTSGVLYFGMLMPLSAAVAGGWMLPIVFAVATSLPVLGWLGCWLFALIALARFMAGCKPCRGGSTLLSVSCFAWLAFITVWSFMSDANVSYQAQMGHRPHKAIAACIRA